VAAPHIDVVTPGLSHHEEDARVPGGPATLRVVPWDDPVVEAAGIDPRDPYVEWFWLPVLGPSATWLLRRLAHGLRTAPLGYSLPLDETARALGLGGAGGRHSPFRRAISRTTRYGLARHLGPDALAVRRAVAPLPRRFVDRLPTPLAAQHDAWLISRNRGGRGAS